MWVDDKPTASRVNARLETQPTNTMARPCLVSTSTLGFGERFDSSVGQCDEARTDCDGKARQPKEG
jgi:hypothetical protein